MKNILILIVILFVGILIIFQLRTQTAMENENDFTTEEPEAPAVEPSSTREEDKRIVNETPISRTGAIAQEVQITSPVKGAMIESPVEVSGEAPGNWFFEASAPVTVVNWDGLIIGEGYITAEGDWMTTEMVPFSGTITYNFPANSYAHRGLIIFKRDNPSDLPENDASVEIPILLTPTE